MLTAEVGDAAGGSGAKDRELVRLPSDKRLGGSEYVDVGASGRQEPRGDGGVEGLADGLEGR